MSKYYDERKAWKVLTSLCKYLPSTFISASVLSDKFLKYSQIFSYKSISHIFLPNSLRIFHNIQRSGMLITIVYGMCTLYPISYANKFDELIYKGPCGVNIQ
jgi:hypothetical protein